MVSDADAHNNMRSDVIILLHDILKTSLPSAEIKKILRLQYILNIFNGNTKVFFYVIAPIPNFMKILSGII